MISEATKQMILEDLAKPGADIRNVSSQYGIPVRLIRMEIGDDPPPSDFPEKFGGFGPERLKPFIISRRRAVGPWPLEDASVFEKHHALYDNGVVEMCQGRDGDWIIQYSIPRINQDKDRLPYFSRVFSDG